MYVIFIRRSRIYFYQCTNKAIAINSNKLIISNVLHYSIIIKPAQQMVPYYPQPLSANEIIGPI